MAEIVNIDGTPYKPVQTAESFAQEVAQVLTDCAPNVSAVLCMIRNKDGQEFLINSPMEADTAIALAATMYDTCMSYFGGLVGVTDGFSTEDDTEG